MITITIAAIVFLLISGLYLENSETYRLIHERYSSENKEFMKESAENTLIYRFNITSSDCSYIITFPDIPEAIVEISNTFKSIEDVAHNCIEIALTSYLDNNKFIPEPSLGKGFDLQLSKELSDTIKRHNKQFNKI